MEAAEGTLRQAQAQMNASSNQLTYTQLVADHDGTISNLSAEIGQVVAAGTPVATIIQQGEREVQIFVPENRLDTIRPNEPAKITFWALENVTADGYISEIASMADQATKTYKVRVAIPSMPEGAKLGMTAKVNLAGSSTTDILIPRSAIYQSSGTPQVWVIKDNKASLRDVTVNGYKDDHVVIKSGLSQGDVVVTAGVNKLSDGLEVRLEGAKQND